MMRLLLILAFCAGCANKNLTGEERDDLRRAKLDRQRIERLGR